MSKINGLIFSLAIIIFISSCKTKSESDHSAAIVIKGREMKMTLYGPYYDVIDQWDEVEFVLNKISQNHSVKKVLIRLVPLENSRKDILFSEYAMRKVIIYFNENNIKYEIRDERVK